MAHVITITLLLLCVQWSTPALYKPNTAGVKLDAPPGLGGSHTPKKESNGPVRPPSIEPKKPRDSPKDVPYSSNQGSAPRSAYIPSPGRPPSLPSAGVQRPPGTDPYITGGYIDAESKPGAFPNPHIGHRLEDPLAASQGADRRASGNPSPPQSQPPQGYKPPSLSPAPQAPPAYPFSGAGAKSVPGYPQVQSPVTGQAYPQTPTKNPYVNKPASTPQQYPAQYNIPQTKPFSAPSQNALPAPRESTNPYATSDAGSQVPVNVKNPISSVPGGVKSAFPAPFQFPDNLKVEQSSPFSNLISFNSPRPFKSRAPVDFPGQESVLASFPDYKTQRPATPSRQPPVANQQAYPSYAAQASPPAQNPPAYPQQNSPAYPQQNPSVYPQQNPSVFTQQNPAISPYGGNRGSTGGYYGYNNAPVGGGNCFQYTYVAEAYRLSDLAKDYPKDAIQKELDKKPYLAPLVGMEAAETKNQAFSPFGFNNDNSFQFDYSRFGFQKEGEQSPADKYGYLLNNKAYPSSYKEGDFAGGYPSSMRPLDKSCPSQQYILRSFFYHGGTCHVVNPEFQQVVYHRCSRRDCNFCGVNRGLSACVEDYRWLTVFAYCDKLTEFSRIIPLRLILPTGCTCQHFPC